MDLPGAGQLCFLAFITILTIVAYVWRPGRAAPPPKEGKTFRVRGVPLEWDKPRVLSFLADQDSVAGPCIRSLASEVNGGDGTATVSFESTPLPLRKTLTGNSWQLPLPEETPRPRQLTLDDDFFGLTTLYAPPPEDHKIE
jgi:hypothetical protein